MNKKIKLVVGICTGICALVGVTVCANRYVAKAYDNIMTIEFNDNDTEIVYNDITAGGQSMCIESDTDTVYIARNDENKITYIDQVKNFSSNSPKYIKGSTGFKAGHANGMTYYEGDLFIASCLKKELDRNIYRLTKSDNGEFVNDKEHFKAYELENNPDYHVTENTYPKNIAYYKTIDNTPYFIVCIDTIKGDSKYLEYIVGYFRNKNNTFRATNYFKIDRGTTDIIVSGNQDIDCQYVNGSYRLLSAYTMSSDNGEYKACKRNITYETDVTNIPKNGELKPSKRFVIDKSNEEFYSKDPEKKLIKFEIQSMKYANINGNIVPITLFHHLLDDPKLNKDNNDKYTRFGALYTYDYQLD